MKRNFTTWLFTLTSISSLIFGSFAIGKMFINGAGATFPYPLYSKWFSEYEKVDPKVHFNYQSIGSGGGIRQFLSKTVDFGASDAPMTDEQLNKAEIEILHIPTVLGAVVVTYNISGVTKGLKLTPDVVADIFLGKITTWDHQRVTSLNPNFNLKGKITVVHRSDGSGTTNIFTDYLSKISEEWKKSVGVGTSVNWPIGLGGKGNEGVAGLVKQMPGSIGYVELIYAELNNLAYADIQNRAGRFILPSIKSVTMSAEGINIPSDYRVSITDTSNKDGYPISGFTYLLVWKKYDNLDKTKKIKDFLHWLISDGQKYAENLHYSKLPNTLVPRLKKTIDTMVVN